MEPMLSWIAEGVRGSESLLFNECTVDGDGPCGVVINVLDDGEELLVTDVSFP